MKTIESIKDIVRAAKRRNRPVDDVSPETTTDLLDALAELAAAREAREGYLPERLPPADAMIYAQWGPVQYFASVWTGEKWLIIDTVSKKERKELPPTPYKWWPWPGTGTRPADVQGKEVSE